HARHAELNRWQQRTLKGFRARGRLALGGALQLGRNLRYESVRPLHHRAARQQHQSGDGGGAVHFAPAGRAGFLWMFGCISKTSRSPSFSSTTRESETPARVASRTGAPSGTTAPSITASLRRGEVMTACNPADTGAAAPAPATPEPVGGRIG